MQARHGRDRDEGVAQDVAEGDGDGVYALGLGGAHEVLALEAVQSRDFAVLLGILLMSSLVIILANILVDILHYWIDPRTRRREIVARAEVAA